MKVEHVMQKISTSTYVYKTIYCLADSFHAEIFYTLNIETRILIIILIFFLGIDVEQDTRFLRLRLKPVFSTGQWLLGC
jgi:hypothetical protein